MTIVARKPAPPFTLVGDDGRVVTLDALAGKPAVLWFYPNPNERHQVYPFVEALPKLIRLGARAFAISNEPVKRVSSAFAKMGYNDIPREHLLTDPDGAMLAAYDALGLHRIYSVLSPGILPSVVLLGAEGKVVRRYPRATFREHFAAVIDRVERLVGKPASATAGQSGSKRRRRSP